MIKKNQIVNFKVGREQFGVPVESVHEIVRVSEITPVPEMPLFVEGIINLRGRIVTVISLSKRMKIEGSVRTKSSRILIVEVDGMVIGLMVDAVMEILRLPEEMIERAPDLASDIGAEYISGVGKLPDRLIILIDLQRILRASEMGRLHQSQLSPHFIAESPPASEKEAA